MCHTRISKTRGRVRVIAWRSATGATFYEVERPTDPSDELAWQDAGTVSASPVGVGELPSAL